MSSDSSVPSIAPPTAIRARTLSDHRVRRDAFRQWFVDLTQLGIANGHEDELSARIAFLGDVDPPMRAPSWRTCRTSSGRARSRLERARAAAMAQATSDPARGLPVLALMLGRRMRRLAAELAFLDDLRSSYEEWLATRPPVESKPAAPDVPALPLASGANKGV